VYLVIPLELVDVVVGVVEGEDMKGLAGQLRDVIPGCTGRQDQSFSPPEKVEMWVVRTVGPYQAFGAVPDGHDAIGLEGLGEVWTHWRRGASAGHHGDR
jgi:hypothetical protein